MPISTLIDKNLSDFRILVLIVILRRSTRPYSHEVLERTRRGRVTKKRTPPSGAATSGVSIHPLARPPARAAHQDERKKIFRCPDPPDTSQNRRRHLGPRGSPPPPIAPVGGGSLGAGAELPGVGWGNCRSSWC
ncbi:hypothetical protein GUJ93_ZPchr0005g14885 [Zizania palustris]|uniref:Uncharacterized protein n=1 Tax=Zizania palustris TaxID=103762 RepID=A0A8J5SH20_ZIZPA|nr:hypothetical protein GUJ93_ZPchr0005g14885 [Zizania palustris]